MERSPPSWKPVVLTTAVFAAVGPLAGLVLIGGPAALFTSVLFGGLPILFAYVIGLPAAAATGLAAGLAARSGRLWIYGLTAIVVGGVAPLVLPIVMGQQRIAPLSLGATGAGAAAVCALLTFRIAGLRFAMPTRILEVMRSWNAGSVLLVVLGVLCTILLLQIGIMVADELTN